MIYAHGGLNDEEKSVERIRIMAPYFKANGIYPLFITWRTGFGESLRAILEDQAKQFGIDLEALRARGMFDDVKEAVLEAKDRAFEAVAEKILAKAVWTQMKQNAAAAITAGGGLRQLAGHLETLRTEFGKDLEIHLLGHSAGAILLGHLCNRLVSRRIDLASLGLYAPACTMAFAADFLGKALSGRRLSRERVYFELLSDRRERDDTVGPYGKSLLYLVSRALEDVHKTPLLGLAAAWNPQDPDGIVNVRRRSDVAAWRKVWADGPKPREHDDTRVDDGRGPIPIAHGSFDNDVAVVGRQHRVHPGQPAGLPGREPARLLGPGQRCESTAPRPAPRRGRRAAARGKRRVAAGYRAPPGRRRADNSWSSGQAAAPQARALLQDVRDLLAAVLDRVLPAPACSLRLIALLQQVHHDSL